MKIPFLTKHYKGSYISGIMETYQRAGIFVSAIQFLAVIIVLYTTSAAPFIARYAPWLSFRLYMLFVVLGVLLLMALVKILVIPSAYTFLNNMMWNNHNPMRRKLEDMETNQEKIMEKLGITDED